MWSLASLIIITTSVIANSHQDKWNHKPSLIKSVIVNSPVMSIIASYPTYFWGLIYKIFPKQCSHLRYLPEYKVFDQIITGLSFLRLHKPQEILTEKFIKSCFTPIWQATLLNMQVLSVSFSWMVDFFHCDERGENGIINKMLVSLFNLYVCLAGINQINNLYVLYL